jgi:hypothetical protein
VYEAVILYLL